MNFYFYSDADCVLKVNGEYFGKISKNYTLANLLGYEFLEFIPLNDTLMPCKFYLTDNLGGILFKINEGALIIPKFLTLRILPYKVVFQRTFNENFCLTVVTDGAIKFYLTGDINVTDELSFLPSKIDFFTNDNYVFLVFKGRKTLIISYDINGNLCFKNLVDDYTVNGNFSYTVYDNLYQPLKFSYTYEISTPFNNTSAYLDIEVTNLSEEFLPYAFLNCALRGVDSKDFLHSSIANKRADLIEFIGSFNLILPPINYNKGEVMIIFEDKIKLLKFIFTDGKISNIFIND